MTTILRQGLESWLHDRLFDSDAFPPQYQKLIQEQSLIGWGQFFQGRITLEWSRLQQLHLSPLPPIKGHDGAHWSKTILTTVFNQWNTLWDARNADRHGRDSATRAKAKKDQAIIQLEALYTLRHKVLHRDRSLFHDHLDDHKEQPTRSIRQWINTYQPLLLKSVKDAKTLSLLNVRTLPHYFG